MLDYIILVIALIGTFIAAFYDLKTSEIPDWVSILIGSFGISIYFISGMISSDFTMFNSSIFTGTIILLIGYLLYYLGQWGEADTLVFGSVGFLIPGALSIFTQNVFPVWYPIHFIVNTFLIGFVYSLIYAVIISVLRGNVFSHFFNVIKNNKIKISFISTAYIIFYISIAFISHSVYGIDYIFLLKGTYLVFILPFIFIPLILFAKIIDTYAFRKNVPVSKLTEGDVLAEDVYEAGLSSKYLVGLSKKDIEKIILVRSQVYIKEGVRFAPVFFLSVLFTWKFGSIVYIICLKNDLYNRPSLN